MEFQVFLLKRQMCSHGCDALTCWYDVFMLEKRVGPVKLKCLCRIHFSSQSFSLLVWHSVKMSLAWYFKLFRVTFWAWHDDCYENPPALLAMTPVCRPILACYFAPNCFFKWFKTKIGYFCTCCNQLKGNSIIGTLIISVSVIAKPQSHSCIMKKCIWLQTCISVVGKTYTFKN